MKNQYKRILVIKLRHLGDVLLSTPVFSALKTAFPDAQIDAYIWKEAESILSGHPAIEKFHYYDRKWKELPLLKRYQKEWKLFQKIRKERYDLVLSLTEGDRGAITAFVSGAKVRVGFPPKQRRMQKIFTHLVKPCPNPRHTVERDLDVVRTLGIFPQPHERNLFFHVPEEAKKKVQKFVGDQPYVVVHAAARWKFKCPPPHVMAEICNQLKMPIVLTGAPSERDFVQQIADLIPFDVCNLAGKTDLKELGALLMQSKGLITVDSVALHMASALQVPVVALFGPTSEQNWGPWNHPRAAVVAQNIACRPCRLDGCGGSKMSDCLWTLSPQQVVNAFYCVACAERPSASSLFVLNSLEMNRTE